MINNRRKSDRKWIENAEIGVWEGKVLEKGNRQGSTNEKEENIKEMRVQYSL